MNQHNSTFKARQPMKRGPCGLKRTAINKVSPKHAASTRAKQAAYRVVDAGPRWCIACGTSTGLEHSHLWSQGMNKHLRAHPLNIVLSCRPCHTLFEHDKRAFAERYPIAWADIASRLEQLESTRWNFFLMKHPWAVSPPK
jgi:hypothetical protein